MAADTQQHNENEARGREASELHGLLYGGVKVVSSPLATVAEPVKKHTKTRSMSESYHNRVQKKWTKRYGTKQVPGAYMTPFGLVAHPVVIEAMKRAI